MSLDPFEKSTRKPALSKTCTPPTREHPSPVFVCGSAFPQRGGGRARAPPKTSAQWGEQWCLIHNQAAASIASCSPPHANRGPAAQPFSAGVRTPAARDDANGSQPWCMPPPAKLGQLACTPRAFPASHFSENVAFFRLPSPPLSDVGNLWDSLMTPGEQEELVD